MGVSELNETNSILFRALAALLKCVGWPNSPEMDHRSAEALACLLEARRHWVPSMAQRIDLADLYADAVNVIRRMLVAASPPLALGDECPFTLDDLIVPRPGSPDIDRLVERLGGGARG